MNAISLLALLLEIAPIYAQQVDSVVWALSDPGYGNFYYPTAQAACAAKDIQSFSNAEASGVYHDFVGPLWYGSVATNDAHYYCGNTYTFCSIYEGCSSGINQNNGSSVTELPWSGGKKYWVAATPPSQAETCSANCVGHPINPGIGNVFMTETDVEFAGGFGAIAFRRYYNSADASGAEFVPGWRHSYDRYITTVYETTPTLYPGQTATVSPEYTTPDAACTSGFSAIQAAISAWANATATYTGGVCVISKASGTIGTLPIQSYPQLAQTPPTPAEYDLIRDDGQTLRYIVQNGAVSNPPGSSLQLAVTASGFTVTDNEDNVETYNTAGVLQSITSRLGIVQTISYDANGRFSGVNDSFGNSLTVSRNAQEAIASVTDNSGRSVQYVYAPNSSLGTVTNLDGTSRSYVYGDTRFPNFLTAEVDEGGAQFVSWGYDAHGRATSTQESGGAGAVTLAYNADGSVTTTDALGAVRTFQYTRAGDINRVSGISGSQCPTCRESAATTYDGGGWVVSRTDYNGNLTCYANDPVRGLELVRIEGFAPGSTCPSNLTTYTPASDTSQRKILTTWHATYRLPTQITRATRTTNFTYDVSGNRLTKTIADTTVTPNVFRTWTYTYDGYGRTLTAKGPRTDVNSTTTYAYYTCTTGYQCGQLQTITDPVGNVTTFNAYDGNGQPLAITDPNGVVTTLTYDARERLTSSSAAGEAITLAYYPTGLPKKVTLPDGSFVQYIYDGAQRLTAITDGAGNSIQYLLDAMGNHTAVSTYDPNQVLGRTQSSVYNTLNELEQTIGAAGTSAVTTAYAYDSNSNQTAINAPLSRNIGKTYDEINRLKKLTDSANGSTTLRYDSNDNLASVQDPLSHTTAYSYDGFGGLIVEASPAGGTTNHTYDSAGNLKTSTDARGVGGGYSYDALNRVTQVDYGDQSIVYTYDAGVNGKGRLTGASDSAHVMTWQYDGLGRITAATQTIAGVTKSVGYGYMNGNLSSVSTPSGQSVSYTYLNGRIQSIAVNGTPLLSGVVYEPFGPIRGWIWGNGTTEMRLHDSDGNPSQITSLESVSYTVDAAYRTVGINNSAHSELSWTYGYDSLNRLTSAQSAGATLGWSYDANGNRLSQTGAAGPTYASGNLSAAYNNRGRLASITIGGTTMSYVYNALGQRVRKSSASDATIFAYDQAGQLLGEYDGTGQLIEETLWLGNLPVATLRPDGAGGVNIFYVHADHVNAPKSITRPSDNATVWRWDRDPFGVTVPNQNPGAAGVFVYNLRLPGQYFDGESGLSYNYFRDYDSQVGRYLESDPIGLNGGNNPYLYVGADPVDLIDPQGLHCLSPAAIKALAGGLTGLISGLPGGVPGAIAGGILGAAVGALSAESVKTAVSDTSNASPEAIDGMNAVVGGAGAGITAGRGGIAGGGFGAAAGWAASNALGNGVAAQGVGGGFGGALGAFAAARGNWGTAFAEARVGGLFGLLGGLAGAMLEAELKRTRDADCDCKK